MMRTTFLIALGLSFATAAITDCTFDAVASQADDNNLEYEYCDTTTGDRFPAALAAPAQLTVSLAGKHDECLVLASDLDDAQLEAQLGLKTRPLFKGHFSTDSAGDVTFALNQYGDANCALVQRHIELEWGTQMCVDAQDASQGIVHDMYFNDMSQCNAFAALTDAERSSQYDNGFSTYADSLIDVWALASPLVDGLTFAVDNKVLSRSFSQDSEFTKESSLCYGIGDTFSPPFLIPVLMGEMDDDNSTSYTVHNKLHAPQTSTGYLCSYDCSEDVNEANSVFLSTLISSGDPAMAYGAGAASIANSACGIYYRINSTTGDFTQTQMLTAALLIGTADPRPCGVCQPAPAPGVPNAFSAYDVFGLLGTTANSTMLPDAAARYTMCQPGDVMSSRFAILEDSAANDFTTPRADCVAADSTTDSASAISMGFAFIASLFVAMH